MWPGRVAARARLEQKRQSRAQRPDVSGDGAMHCTRSVDDMDMGGGKGRMICDAAMRRPGLALLATRAAPRIPRMG